MNVDPLQNVVVFQFRDGETAVAAAPTRDDDSIRQAWRTALREHRATAGDVTALHSEWEPADGDLRFIEQTFPAAELTYNFSRPAPDGWPKALLEAREVMRAATAAKAEEDEAKLLPLLCSASSPRAEPLLKYLPHEPVVPGKLFVSLAQVGWTPRGTIGLDHLTHNAFAELGHPFADLMDLAGENLRDGLRIEGRRTEEVSGDLVTMSRPGTQAASALVLPDFHERMSDLLGDSRIVVGLPCHDEILVAGAGSGWPGEIERIVLGSQHPVGFLTPSVLLMDGTSVQLVAERPAPPG